MEVLVSKQSLLLLLPRMPRSSTATPFVVCVSELDRLLSSSYFVTERLRNIFTRNENDDDDDADLLLQQNDREDNVLQWIQALDLQVTGACRADERLKPLLKLNVSGGGAEDHLLAHLSQCFEVSEVGMLARCLCIPLVSIRVGRVTKQGSLLCPTGTRGDLNLTLLPSSGLRISFVGDDGCIERLATLSCNSESSVSIEEIPADKSGRSFLIKLPDGRVSYFWCSEKSKLLGFEMLEKMKDLVTRKPSLAQLTGISESRLDCFATNIRSYLGATLGSDTTSSAILSGPPQCDSNSQIQSSSAKSSRSRCINGQAGKQGSLSPRSNSFKEGALRNSSSIRSGTRDKFRRRGDIHCIFSAVDASISAAEASSFAQSENRKVSLSEGIPCSFLPLSSLDLVGKSAFPFPTFPSLRSTSPQNSTNASAFSPYYCWCPPCTSALQYTVTPPHLLISSTECVSLPPLSTLLSAAVSSSSLSPPKLPFDLADVPSLDFPALLPDPMVRAPLPISSFITVSSSPQIPIFSPLICDPIVHIPVIDVCSSGQAYLVSAGPTISTTISPLCPNFVNPMVQDTESMVDKNARETLRLLLSSTQTNPQLMSVFPSVFTSTDDKHNMVVGNRGLYSGTRDVECITNSMAAMGLVSLPRSEVDVARSYTDHELEAEMENIRASEECCCTEDDTKVSTTSMDTRERLDAA